MTRPEYLQNAQVNIIPNELCYKIQNNTERKKYFNNGFCVLGKNKETACKGDSGSPIIWENPKNKRIYLVGIYSSRTTPPHIVQNPNAPSCGQFSEFPAKYTKIIDGESDSRHLLKYWFNGDNDFCQAKTPRR